ncbi:MAG TPA: hypothetical protein VHN11_00320 [Xanthobacteraceae bacterium]|jgi:hypothetical protein|nr:hypothetical protein [Xanthobacteraceae bacterium]
MKPTSALFVFDDAVTVHFMFTAKGRPGKATVTIGSKSTVFDNAKGDYKARVTDAMYLIEQSLPRPAVPSPEETKAALKPMRRRTNGSPRSARRTKRVPGLKVVR